MRNDPPSGTRVRRALALCVALSAVILPAACGGDDSSGSGGSGSAESPEIPTDEVVDQTGKDSVEVSAVDNRFEPEFMEVSPGTEVTFTNDGRTVHNVLATQKGQFEDIPADEFAPGDSASVTFEDPGTYPYYCSLHGTTTKGMIGAVIVKE